MGTGASVPLAGCTLSGQETLGLKTLQFIPGARLENETFARRRAQRLDFAIQYCSQGMKFRRRLRRLRLPTVFIAFISTIRLSYEGSGKRLVRSRTLARICSSAAASSRRFRASLIRSAISSISSSFMPRVVTAGVPMRMPPGLKIG